MRSEKAGQGDRKINEKRPNLGQLGTMLGLSCTKLAQVGQKFARCGPFLPRCLQKPNFEADLRNKEAAPGPKPTTDETESSCFSSSPLEGAVRWVSLRVGGSMLGASCFPVELLVECCCKLCSGGAAGPLLVTAVFRGSWWLLAFLVSSRLSLASCLVSFSTAGGSAGLRLVQAAFRWSRWSNVVASCFPVDPSPECCCKLFSGGAA